MVPKASTAPAGYSWGIAKRSRFAAKPYRHLVCHEQTVCTGAPALIENSAGRDCPECIDWLREYDREEEQ